MTEPAATDGLVDPETALRRTIDTLAQRFPDVDHAHLEERIRSTYAQLKREATVDSHLLALTEGHVTAELRQDGQTVHVRSDETD